MTRRRKHKRGARGSAEEDTNTRKRADMAAMEDIQAEQEITSTPLPIEEPETSTDEANLKEHREMLVDIHISILNILRENKNTRDDLGKAQHRCAKRKQEEINALYDL